MSSITRTITVTRKGMQHQIQVVEGTSLLPISVIVSDYDILSGSAAVAYNRQPNGTLVNQACTISENTISFTPPEGFYIKGYNKTQVRVTNNNRNLFSFVIDVWCDENITDDADVEEINSQPTLVTQLLSQIGVLTARMDAFTALPEGSTTSDAALNDIRIGYDGTEYQTPGDAVRGQVGSLSEDIDDLKGNIIKHIPDNSIGSQKINALSDNKPEGNILTDDILEITNLKNNVNVGTQLIYKIPYSEENKGKKVRIKAKRIRFRYQKTDITEKEVEDLEGVGYVKITLPISTYYGETWVIFDITQDISYVYGLFEDDWVDVDIRKKKIEWIYSDTIDKKLENVCNQHIKDNSSINFETGEIDTYKNYTSAVTDFIPTVLGDCFYAYYKKIAIGGYNNQMTVGMYNSDKDYIGKLLQKKSTALDDGWYKFCIPTKECAYVRITFYREKPIVFRCDPEYEFDGDESKISLSYGIEFSKAITAKNQINQAPLKRFEGKKLCVAGDSITEANSTNQNTPWGTIIARQFSMILTNAGKSGSGLFKLGDTGKGLYYRLQSREGEWAEGTDYDYIILCGFMNDGTSKNQYQSINYNGINTWDALPTGDPGDEIGAQSVYGMLRGCFEFLIQYYPLAKIGFVSSTPRGQITNAVRDTPEGVDKSQCHGHAWFEEYIKAYKYVCEEYNIPFLDIYHNSPFRVNMPENYKLYFTNWESEISTYGGVVHPNALGQEIAIANPIFQWMKTYL